MAGETRRQRRDARRAAGESPARDAVRPPVQPGSGAAVPVGHVETHRRGGFVRESWAELLKVDWPNRSQVIQGTVVVLIACAIVGAFLWGADQVLRPFVRDVLLGQ